MSKTVIIVDDDSITRGLLSKVLSAHSGEFNVVTAENGKDAIEKISKIKIDLVITDIQMPVLDGFQLLAYLSKKHPEIPTIVMTAFGDPEVEARSVSIGTSQYFEKPLNMDELTKCIFSELDAGAEGRLCGIGIPSFLQLIEMEDKTCTISIESKGREGTFYFQKGELFDAETTKLKHEDAAYEMIAWDRATIGIENNNKKTTKTIKLPLMTILMGGLKIKDENKPVLRPLTKFSKKRKQ